MNATAAQTASPPTPRLTHQDIDLMPRGRHLMLGMSDVGKSTLEMRLIEHWLDQQPEPRVLILDGKPRFRAEWELSGLSAKRRYKGWTRGDVVPNSVALDFSGHSGSIRAQLKQAWSLKFHSVIAQTSDQKELLFLRAAADWFYTDSQDKYSQLLVVDELADFFGTTGAASRGDALLKVVRSGREKNISFLGAAQRPKGLPQSFMTEVSAVYLFKLRSKKDMQHLEDLGLPGAASPPSKKHIFYFWNDYTERSGLARLGDVKSDGNGVGASRRG